MKRTEYFKGFDNGSLTPSFQLAMLWASVGNTMPATFWLLFFLLSNPAAMETLMKQIKMALDPLGIMNPGKVLPD